MLQTILDFVIKEVKKGERSPDFVNTCKNFSNSRVCADKETHYNLYPDSE